MRTSPVSAKVAETVNSLFALLDVISPEKLATGHYYE